MAQIINVDILDDNEPLLLVQQFVFDDRTLLVIRKPTEEDGGDFHLSPGITLNRQQYWTVDRTLFETAEELGDESLEQFALIYRAEDNQPVSGPTHLSGAMPYASIVYDPEADVYRAEPVYKGYDELGEIGYGSFEATLQLAIHKLHELLAQRGE